MKSLFFLSLLLAVATTNVATAINVGQRRKSRSPARGYDTWDGFGLNINETVVMETAEVLSKQFVGGGYQYLVLDEGWSHDGSKTRWVLNDHGIPIPNPMLFPSAAMDGTFKKLASTLQSEYNIDLGVWLIRGVPRQAVELNLTVPGFGGSYPIKDIVDLNRTCDWHPDVYALDMSHPGANQYLDNMFQTYTSWGLKYFKVDCIFAANYDLPEIEGTVKALNWLATSFKQDTVLSLSPGDNSNLEQAMAVTKSFNYYESITGSYRITGDMWACWNTLQEMAYLHEPFGHCILNSTRKVIEFASLIGQGDWTYPDGDMLPLGNFGGPSGPWNTGPDGMLTPFNQGMLRFTFGLWSIIGMPIILGGDLRTVSEMPHVFPIVNNTYLKAIHQTATNQTLIAFEDTESSNLNSIGHVVWASRNPHIAGGVYLGLFAFSENYNLTAPTSIQVTIPVESLVTVSGIPSIQSFYMVNVWTDGIVESISDQQKTGQITMNVTANDGLVLVLEPRVDAAHH